MKRRRARTALIVAASLAGFALLLALSTVLTLRSGWFREKVRERIVAEVERATGGRCELGSFYFDWRRLRAEVRGFVLHGTEDAGKPPLFRADTAVVGLKILSAVRKKVDLESVEIRRPHLYLIVYPDGRTNVPQPKLPRASKPALQSILDLAVRRFQADDGVFELEGRGRIPFQLRGRELAARLAYDRRVPRYLGEIGMRPLDIQWGGRRPLPVDVNLAVGIEARRILVTGARAATGGTQVDFSGEIASVAPFTARFDYEARVRLTDLGRILEVSSPPSGDAVVKGVMTFRGLADYEASGVMHAVHVAWREGAVRLRDFRADGKVKLTPGRLEGSDIRLSGDAFTGARASAQRAGGHVAHIAVYGRDADAHGIALAAMGGTFSGSAELRDAAHYRVAGAVAGFESRRLLALYSSQQVPWNARISGQVKMEGSLRSRTSMAASARLAVAPADGPPVHGSIEAVYSARGATLDLGHSWLGLPSTRVDFSGVLGRSLAVRLESRDLDDLLPALDMKSLPVKLEGGSATFQGSITGPLDNPQVAGQAGATRVAIRGTSLDSFTTQVAVSKTAVKFQDAALARGKVRARFNAEAALRDGKLADASQVYGTGAVRGAPLSELLAAAGQGGLPADGTLDATAELTGTYGAARLALDLTAVKGSLYGEPFDRLTAKAAYGNTDLEVAGAQLVAGRKQVAFKGAYRHERGDFGNGTVLFDAVSNRMAIEDIHTVHEKRPDLTGTVQLSAGGRLAVVRAPGGRAAVRVTALGGDATVAGIAVSGRRLGDAHMAANTQGETLTARLDSNFAGSAFRGDGTVRLAEDYPGTARVTFSRLDFIRLRELFNPTASGRALPVAGSMAGEVTFSGPMLTPASWKASVDLPELQLGPAPGSGFGNGKQDFTLRNAGTVAASMSGGVLRIERARFVGRATDLSLSGSAAVDKNALDLRLKGRIDLATMQDFDRDITASGFLITDAAIRGSLHDPQVNGRLEMKNGEIQFASISNGIYNANGVLMFNGTRATIQSLTGESGGGKVRLAGFVGYESEQLIFRLFSRAEQVRLRYPEGVSTVANAALTWSGSGDRSTLAGTISILRTGFNPQSDFSSILARSAEPVRTPAAGGGILSGMHLDVQIDTAPDIAFESSLAQDIQVEAGLRLRGTATNPSLLGRVNVTQGRLIFFGTRYTINQGSISFFNPSRIEPIFNVDLETRARGIDITLTVSGPMNKLNLTPRSDPPLQFNEIVALLATGRKPSDLSYSSQQTTNQQSWQQLGASALLGQAIASPVAGRLQRFFGVTRLKIDPTLTGVESNPQARVTLEQQITPDITFTYITNVTNSNPLVVQVEWAMSKKWSVLAVRDENGMFGLDFLYKKRF